jgi:hypothetical protein
LQFDEVGGTSSGAGAGLLKSFTTDYTDCTDGKFIIRVIREFRGSILSGAVGAGGLSRAPQPSESV